MRVIGVDPGAQGGWAVVDGVYGREPVLRAAGALPHVPNPEREFVGSKKRIEVDALAGVMAARGLGWVKGGEQHYVIERSQGMPGQSIAATFNYAASYGMVVALALRAAGERRLVSTVRPTAWKPTYGLGSDKEAARAKATEIFGSEEWWPRKKHEGVAEAALIAAWKLNRLLAIERGDG